LIRSDDVIIKAVHGLVAKTGAWLSS